MALQTKLAIICAVLTAWPLQENWEVYQETLADFGVLKKALDKAQALDDSIPEMPGKVMQMSYYHAYTVPGFKPVFEKIYYDFKRFVPIMIYSREHERMSRKNIELARKKLIRDKETLIGWKRHYFHMNLYETIVKVLVAYVYAKKSRWAAILVLLSPTIRGQINNYLILDEEQHARMEEERYPHMEHSNQRKGWWWWWNLDGDQVFLEYAILGNVKEPETSWIYRWFGTFIYWIAKKAFNFFKWNMFSGGIVCIAQSCRLFNLSELTEADDENEVQELPKKFKFRSKIEKLDYEIEYYTEKMKKLEREMEILERQKLEAKKKEYLKKKQQLQKKIKDIQSIFDWNGNAEAFKSNLTEKSYVIGFVNQLPVAGGASILHWAAEKGLAEAIEVVISIYGRRIDFNAKNSNRETLLEIAIEKAHVNVVKLLTSQRNYSRVTKASLTLAKRIGNSDIIDHIKSKLPSHIHPVTVIRSRNSNKVARKKPNPGSIQKPEVNVTDIDVTVSVEIDSIYKLIDVEDFMCTKCYHLKRGTTKIFGCSKDHLICDSCLAYAKQCRLCRENFDTRIPNRRITAERLIYILFEGSSLYSDDN